MSVALQKPRQHALNGKQPARTSQRGLSMPWPVLDREASMSMILLQARGRGGGQAQSEAAGEGPRGAGVARAPTDADGLGVSGAARSRPGLHPAWRPSQPRPRPAPVGHPHLRLKSAILAFQAESTSCGGENGGWGGVGANWALSRHSTRAAAAPPRQRARTSGLGVRPSDSRPAGGPAQRRRGSAPPPPPRPPGLPT